MPTRDKLLGFLRSRALRAGRASSNPGVATSVRRSRTARRGDRRRAGDRWQGHLRGTHGGRVWRAAVEAPPPRPRPDIRPPSRKSPSSSLATLSLVGSARISSGRCASSEGGEQQGFACAITWPWRASGAPSWRPKTAKTDQELSEIKAEAEIYYEAICELVPDLEARARSPRRGLKDLVRDLRQERGLARGQAFGFREPARRARAERPHPLPGS